MRLYTLDQVQDKLLGKVGTTERDRFEAKLRRALKRMPSNVANDTQPLHGPKLTSNFQLPTSKL